MTASDDTAPGWLVTFDRVGRDHDVPPLTMPLSVTCDLDAMAKLIGEYAAPRLLSSDVEVRVRPNLTGYILVGFFRPAGDFTITAIPAVPLEVRSLTVIPPWSLAIVQGHKLVENRGRNIAGEWRGRVLVLSSVGKWDEDAAEFVADQTGHPVLTRPQCHPGHYVGAVDLVDVHQASGGCCGPFGEPDVWHLQLANPVQFATPIRATGHLGLRRVTDPPLIHAATTSEGTCPHGNPLDDEDPCDRCLDDYRGMDNEYEEL